MKAPKKYNFKSFARTALILGACGSPIFANVCVSIEQVSYIRKSFPETEGRIRFEDLIGDQNSQFIGGELVHEKHGLIYVNKVEKGREGTLEIFDKNYGRRRIFYQSGAEFARKDSEAAKSLLTIIALTKAAQQESQGAAAK